MRRIILVSFLLLTFVGGKAGADNFMWEVQSETATVYLLGSIHVLKADFYPLANEIEQTFDSSDIAVFETHLDSLDNPAIAIKMMASAMYPAGKTLKTELSDSLFLRLKSTLNQTGVPIDLWLNFKPWFVAMTLSMQEMMAAGFKPDLGLDRHFFDRAQKAGKGIEALEAVDFQIELLSQLSDVDQELFLLYTFEDLQLIKTMLDEMVVHWKTGRADKLHELITRSVEKHAELDAIFEKLIYARNVSMSARIEEYLKSDQTYFVVVGAGHLTGEQGIVAKLAARGYSVRQK